MLTRDDPEELVRRLFSDQAFEERDSIKKKLVHLGSKAIPPLLSGLSDDHLRNDDIGEVLREIGKDGLNALLDVAEHGELTKRAAAIRALWEFEEDAACIVPWILEQLDSAEPQVRWRLVHLLARIGPPASQAAQRIAELASNADDDTRASAIYALEQIGYDANVLAQIALEALTPIGTKACEYALSALKRIDFDPSASLGSLASILRSATADFMAKCNAVTLLGHCQSERSKAVGILLHALHESYLAGSERNLAVEHLFKLGAEVSQLLPFLIDYLNEEPESTCDALCVLGPEAAPAVPHLIHLLETQTDYWDACWAAVDALGAIGPAAVLSLPVLEKLQQHDSPLVRQRCGIAVRKIRGENVEEEEEE